MVIITVISGAPTMFHAVGEMIYAHYSYFLRGVEEGCYAISRKLLFGGTISI